MPNMLSSHQVVVYGNTALSFASLISFDFLWTEPLNKNESCDCWKSRHFARAQRNLGRKLGVTTVSLEEDKLHSGKVSLLLHI